jgi:CRISPR-associated protein Csd1
LKAALEAAAKGRAAQSPEFDPDTRVYFLGLAPNAARLSVRFWQPGSFGGFARHITRFWDDLALEPSPWKTNPAAWSLLYEVAARRDAKTIPPRLGGDLMRAVLTGAPYPRTLLSGVINRIRADGDINGKRAAICRAVINRNTNREEIPMSLDRENPNPAYRLGRLFAVLERTQQAALPGLNATIRDRYFAAASATPARIFPQLAKNATHHLSLMRKSDRGWLAHWLDREMGEIWGGLEADLPRSLNLEDQGRFVAGYYHQRWTKKDTEGAEAPQDNVVETGSTEQ